ncbi:glycosyl transferase family 1 [Aggregatibacter actinomycetemcomitans]|uniref:Mannosyl transferase n=1 Tax=Aggregatibacter actinomycetemcomitans TaxID=714 RepID=Q9JRR8_AGGAC|nr:glycosyltransferase family 4 protein [Aggregatibacter actinomycetemcomitans]ANU82919.1 glycosyl transferase family 1 [Aggregatibacter actinomycetemcomitans]KOE66664.1 glycosyl transferase family 1 [Aggregatibacter actinomycetemcomitans serotype d str. I63B]KYK82416.1 glycosyl transferase family 1 [Aggregatibacter actinomycetemcomitans serotype d str. SA3033]KYK89889.1 glycosyl transferase family 1 [Aggregatibacter actinomycetemcomitans serotype d str. SA2200]MBN6073498.1 glycosyltransferase
MKKALVHDWFSAFGGAEKCIVSLTNIWNDFDIYSLIDFLNEENREIILGGKKAHTSFIQNLPKSKEKYRNYLPLFPFAIEQFNLEDYDLILSSSHCVAKGVLTHSNQLHISYVHTPVRYAWDLYFRYLKDNNLDKGLKGILARYFLHKLRIWDLSTINRVDYYIANSHYIARRMKKVYGKEADVIYPPVDVDKFQLCAEKESFYLTASRLVPYKKIDLIVEAFSKTDKKLVVVGNGPDMEKIKSKASKNIEILGYQPDMILLDLMKKAKAFVFAAEEDFGIIPVEAQACGTPVICFNKGGTKETVINNKTGIYFDKQDINSVLFAINEFERKAQAFEPDSVRENALRFSRQRFEKEIKEYIEDKYQIFRGYK